MAIHTRLKEIRTARGLPAAELARYTGVTRQTIYAIEEGGFVPNTAVSLKLARVLSVTVEELFSIGDGEQAEPTVAHALSAKPLSEGQLVNICDVNGSLLAVPASSAAAYLPMADGFVQGRAKNALVVQCPEALPQAAKRLLVAGCDPGLSLLNAALRSSGVEIVAIPCASRRALQWLKEGKVHAAGSHLQDRATGNFNVPIVKRMLGASEVRIVTFAAWEQGLAVRPGNPKAIRSVADLAEGPVLINRDRGSGSRDLLDAELLRAGIKPAQVNGYRNIADGHLAAASAVAAGTADCCVVNRSAARCYGLGFIPLAVHRFDISLLRSTLELPAAKSLLDELNRLSFRRKLERIAGYEVAATGQLLI